MKRIIFIVGLFVINVFGYSQQFQINQIGDTINRYNSKNQKIGLWEEKTDGFTVERGFYSDGVRNGQWVRLYPNGQIQEVLPYLNGKLNGVWLKLDNRGNLLEEKNYVNDKLHGISKNYSYGRVTYEATYKNDKLNGKVIKYYENGMRQEEGNYLNGVRHGTTIWFNQKGQIVAEYNYKEGELDGEQKTYYPEENKIAKRENYKKNLLNGESIEYHKNGNIKIKGFYVDDQKDGLWIEYNEDGKEIKQTRYSKGKEVK